MLLVQYLQEEEKTQQLKWMFSHIAHERSSIVYRKQCWFYHPTCICIIIGLVF